jgi:hypothetical protein
VSDAETPSTNHVDREMYANWYEWAHRSVSKEQNKAHAAAWAAAVAAARGSDSVEMERAARLAAKDKQAVNGTGADAAIRSYAEWFLYAVTKLGVTGDVAHRAAAAAQGAANSDDAAFAAEQAAGVHGEFSRARLSQTEREQAFARVERECPFPVTKEKVSMPGGLQLMNDEFLVTSGQDWGFSSQRILITTHRAIWTHGRILDKQQNAIYLIDIRDVIFKKPMVGYGSLAFETSSGHVIEALPKVSNGAQVRNSLLTLIHYARNRGQQPQAVAIAQLPAVATPAPDRYEQLKKLADLKAQGILSEEEFQAEKAKILAS